MTLTEAMLLEPSPFEVWISRRSDGSKGSGTMNDPWDGSTTDRFDEVMRNLTGGTTVHLGPGTFTTRGYADGMANSWQVQPNMRIFGAGIDVTTMQLVEAATVGQHYFAVGHKLNVGATSEPNWMNFFELGDGRD